MSEDEPQLPESIRKALKKSPAFTPPESFYQGVLREIERKRSSADKPSPWYWGYPARGLATACVLAVIVLVAREKRKSEPEGFQQKFEPEKAAAIRNESSPAPEPIANLLSGGIRKKALPPAPPSNADAKKQKIVVLKDREVVRQARDTAGGTANQGSFLQEQKALAKAAPLLLPAAAARSGAAQSAGGFSGKEDAVRQWKGGRSGIAEFRTVIIQTPEQWQTLWREHANYIVPPPPAPDLDFGNFIVVGIFAGTRPTAGYAVEITDISTLPDKVIVIYRETTPPAGMMTAQVITQPYHLRLIPKTNLPITFQREL